MKPTYSSRIAIAVLAICAVAFCACSDDTPTQPDASDEAQRAVLSNLGTNVLMATYVDLDAKADLLVQAVDAFDADPTQTALDAAREAWRQTRRPWEQSEGFLFGPVETNGIDPAIDSWPVNRADLDAVLAGNAVLTQEYVASLEGTLKGFHTIEYLLFGDANDKTLADFTDRDRDYLAAVVQAMKARTAALAAAWSVNGGNFVAEVTDPGRTGSVYVSNHDVLQELTEGMIGIADEVGNGKINDPFVQQDASLVESQFSFNSLADFANNIRSIENVWLGRYGSTDGDGIGALVAERDPDLDAKVRGEITDAIDAIRRMTPDFRTAIAQNRAAVSEAQQSVRALQETLQAEVLPLINDL